jgi:hypothetical protein
MLSRTKQKPVYETYAERAFYAPKILWSMHKQTLVIAPFALVVPLFSVARCAEAGEQINVVWTRAGRGCMRYKGTRLTQSHQTVLFTLANLRAGEVVSNAFSFFPSELLLRMGWSDNSRNADRLRQMLDDLKEGNVRLWKEGQIEHLDSLRVNFVEKFQPSATDRWYVMLSEYLLPLFAGKHPTYLNMPHRARLREGLATFMYAFLSAESCLLPFKFQDIHDAAGADYSDIKDFVKSCKLVLEQLKTGGLIKDYRLKGDADDMAQPARLRMKKGEFRVLKTKSKAA